MSQQRLAVTFRQLQNKFYSSALMLEKCSGDDLSMSKMTKLLIMIMFLSQAFMTENSVCLWGKWAYTRISVWISDSTVTAQCRLWNQEYNQHCLSLSPFSPLISINNTCTHLRNAGNVACESLHCQYSNHWLNVIFAVGESFSLSACGVYEILVYAT